MSRSGYSDDCENLGLYRGAVERAIKGWRGQALLRELLAALDAMPKKRLIPCELEDWNGEVCALGCVGKARGLPLRDPEFQNMEASDLAVVFDVAESMAREITYVNDEMFLSVETPEQRWHRVRAWVVENLRDAK